MSLSSTNTSGRVCLEVASDTPVPICSHVTLPQGSDWAWERTGTDVAGGCVEGNATACLIRSTWHSYRKGENSTERFTPLSELVFLTVTASKPLPRSPVSRVNKEFSAKLKESNLRRLNAKMPEPHHPNHNPVAQLLITEKDSCISRSFLKNTLN